MRPLAGIAKPHHELVPFLTHTAHAVTRAEVLQHWTRRALENALRSGDVTRVLPGIYAATVHMRRPRVWGEALNLWHPAGRVTGALALHLLNGSFPAPSSQTCESPTAPAPAHLSG